MIAPFKDAMGEGSGMASGNGGEDARKIRLLMELRRGGITDTAVLAALERTPREIFVPEVFQDRAYENAALPIESGQTISQPYVVAFMTEALRVNDRCKVLEIGTGSGYQTAILAQLARRVYTIERHAALLDRSEKLFQKLDLHKVVVKLGDGSKGWPEQAPFDRIMVTAAAPEIPSALVDQLGEDGIMVVPVGGEHEVQCIVRITRTAGEVTEENLLDVRFVPLVSGGPVGDRGSSS